MFKIFAAANDPNTWSSLQVKYFFKGVQLTSTELGILWKAHISLSGRILIYDLVKDKTIDKEAQNILISAITESQNVKNQIETIFKNEKTVIPMGFNENDIVREAPPLFDDLFNIMFLRQMTKLVAGYSAVYSTMSYAKEVQDAFKITYDAGDKYYGITTNYLLGKGVLAKPPYVTMPKEVEFIEDNIFGMQLMTGFAQVATESEVKKYFIEGKELSKKIVSELSDLLLQSDIQPPSTWAGRAMNSTKSPFSDKLMLYITSLISSSAIGYNALGTSFSLRSDLHRKLALISKDIFNYSKKGGKIMIKHKWMEEPPQMEDRNQLTKSK